jgi:hypothetical protein
LGPGGDAGGRRFIVSGTADRSSECPRVTWHAHERRSRGSHPLFTGSRPRARGAHR